MIDIGQSFSFYLDVDKKLFVLETRNFGKEAYRIELKVNKIIKYTRPTSKEDGEVKQEVV